MLIVLFYAGALDTAAEDLDHVGETGRAALQRHGVRIGRHSIFLPALVKPRAAHTLALLWHAAHPGGVRSVLLARPGALSTTLEQPRSWGECAAAGYRACGRIAVRLDLVERLAEAAEADAAPADAALARLIGRPVRDLLGIMSALGYRRVAAEEGEPARWRRSAVRRRPKRGADPDNAFSALANLLPSAVPGRRRRSRPA